jgi:hypothetical protein
MNTLDWMTSFSRLYDLTKGRWTGCDWTTKFGAAELNLSGVTARQAALLARATSGQESADWQQAAQWLTRVEADAEAARQAAQTAEQSVAAGRLQEALAHADRAVKLEEPYHRQAYWQEFKNAILQQLAHDE